MDEKIKEVELALATLQENENKLKEEERIIFLEELQKLLDDINKDTEEFLEKVKGV